jgi:predicted dehydrogenase
MAMATGETVRLGVIGAGGFAEICHVPGLQSHPRAEVVALCGRNRERCEAMAARLGVPETITDYRELVARPDVDAVTITTPNVAHHPIAMAALAAGKHVFCEKPLAMNREQATELRRAAEASGLIHQVAFTFRFTHCLRRLREELARGTIGRPFYARVRGEWFGDLRSGARVGWRHVQALAGGGMLADMGSHYFDLVHWIIGPIAEVSGMLVNVPREGLLGEERVPIDTDDLAACWFRTESGVPGHFISSRVTPSHGAGGFFEVIGEDGALFAATTRGSGDSLRLLRPGQPQEELPLPEESRSKQDYGLGRMMRAFVDAILAGRSAPDVDATFVDGWRAQCAQDAVYQSVREKRWAPVNARD